MPVNEPQIVHLENGQLKGMTAADVDAILRGFSSSPSSDRLVIHFHGGLVSATEGMAIAKRLQADYSDAGGYPVFFVWESAWYETLANNINEILGEDVFKALLKLVIRKALEKLGVDAAGERGLGPSLTQVEKELTLANRGQEPFVRVDPSRLTQEYTLTQKEEREFLQELAQNPDLGRAVGAIVDDIDATPPATA